MVRFPCQNLVSIRYSPPEILQFYNFAILAGKCLTTPPSGGFEPLNIVGRHPNPQKAHPWVTTRHWSHKWLKIHPGVRPGRSCEKKRYNQNRTGQQKSQKRNISHIWGKLPVRYCNEIWHRGRCPRDSYVGKVWSLKFKGCKFYRGLKFGLLHWHCLWALTQCWRTNKIHVFYLSFSRTNKICINFILWTNVWNNFGEER